MNINHIFLETNLRLIDQLLVTLLNVHIDFVKSNMAKEAEAAKRGIGPKELKLMNDFLDSVKETQRKAVLFNNAGNQLLKKVSASSMN